MKDEAKEKHCQDYEELVQELFDDGMDEEEANDKAYHQIRPTIQNEGTHIYLETLMWERNLRKDPIHRKVMETKRSFIDYNRFDGEEALDAAANL